MNLRKNVRSLSRSEISDFVYALIQVQKTGRFEKFVHWHQAAMQPSVRPWEPNDPDYRNSAHNGPSFLPWHREMLVRLENELRLFKNTVTIPYWDWSQDSMDPLNSPIWSSDFMGGNGVKNDHWRVANGPFSYRTGQWDVPAYPDHVGYEKPGLKRQFGKKFGGYENLPSREDILMALNEEIYDTPPYCSSPFTVGFRNRLEGWVTQRGDPQVKTTGTQLHNRVHVWIGGDMLLMTSPNDPIFFLHHCFVDKIWADWQSNIELQKPNQLPAYAPQKLGPNGHNFEDYMNPWSRKISDVYNIEKLGYAYERSPLSDHRSINSREKSPFL